MLKRIFYRTSQHLNFGQSKGLSFDRVLVFPANPISRYLESGIQLEPGSKSKLYVGITRARHGVAFVTNSPAKNFHQATVWKPAA